MATAQDATLEFLQSELARICGGAPVSRVETHISVVLLSPTLVIPPEIEKEVSVLDVPLPTYRDLVQLLGLTEGGEGVHIFIGSENKLFSLSDSSLIVAPFEDQQRKVVGVLGVIGPTRLNYARIIPMVDYTAKLVGQLLT